MRNHSKERVNMDININTGENWANLPNADDVPVLNCGVYAKLREICP